MVVLSRVDGDGVGDSRFNSDPKLVGGSPAKGTGLAKGKLLRGFAIARGLWSPTASPATRVIRFLSESHILQL